MEKAKEYPDDERNAQAAQIFTELAAMVDDVDEQLLQAHEELFVDLPDVEEHVELLRTVGFHWWPSNASEFYSSLSVSAPAVANPPTQCDAAVPSRAHADVPISTKVNKAGERRSVKLTADWSAPLRPR
jgi:hypothetical protein